MMRPRKQHGLRAHFGRVESAAAGSSSWKATLIREWEGGLSPSKDTRGYISWQDHVEHEGHSGGPITGDEVIEWLEHRKKNGWTDADGVVLPNVDHAQISSSRSGSSSRIRSAGGSVERTLLLPAEDAQSMPAGLDRTVFHKTRSQRPRPATSPTPQIQGGVFQARPTTSANLWYSPREPQAVRQDLRTHSDKLTLTRNSSGTVKTAKHVAVRGAASTSSNPDSPKDSEQDIWRCTQHARFAKTGARGAFVVQSLEHVSCAPDSRTCTQEKNKPRRFARAGLAVWNRVSTAAALGVSEDEQANSDRSGTSVDWTQTDMDDGSKLTGVGDAPHVAQCDDLFDVDFRSRELKHNIDMHEKVHAEAWDNEASMFRRRTDSPKTRRTVNWESVAEEENSEALPIYCRKLLPNNSIAASADADSPNSSRDLHGESPGNDLCIAQRENVARVPCRPVSSSVYKQRHRRIRLSNIAASDFLSASLTPSESFMWNSQAAKDDFLVTYLLKGKINEHLSTSRRQVIIIDDRKPLSPNIIGVNIGGGLALPPKKISSSVGVRERELLIAQRKLDEIANMFVRDRENGGPETRRMQALGEESRLAADLRKELFGVDTAVCPTCEDKINPVHQHHYSVQDLLERQEKWEEDGCFGHAPYVTCRHKHSNTAHDVLSKAAQRKAKGISDEPRDPGSPDGVGAWGSGESTTELLRNMKMQKLHAPPQTKSSSFQRKRASSCASEHFAANSETVNEVEASHWTDLESSDICESSEQASGTREGTRESSDRALKPHQTGLDESTGVGSKPDWEHATVATRTVGVKESIEDAREQIGLYAEALLAQVEEVSEIDESLRQVSEKDDSLREKLHQLHVPGELVRKNAMAHEEGEPDDPDAEIVKTFGVEIRLTSVRVIVSFMAEQIRQRYFDTVPAPDELLNMAEKSEWIRQWIRAEGTSGSLKFIIQSNIGGGEPDNAAREAKTTISFMNPNSTKKANSRWEKTRVLKDVGQLHWSRRRNTWHPGESTTAGGKTEKTDQFVFRMLTFIRSNPLGVRGPKDIIVL